MNCWEDMRFKDMLFLDQQEKFAALYMKSFISKQALGNQLRFPLNHRKFVRNHLGYWFKSPTVTNNGYKLSEDSRFKSLSLDTNTSEAPVCHWKKPKVSAMSLAFWWMQMPHWQLRSFFIFHFTTKAKAVTFSKDYPKAIQNWTHQ